MILGSCTIGAYPKENTQKAPVPSEYKELEREEGMFRDEQTQIDLPAEYKAFDILVDIDDEYCYLANSTDFEYWRRIALNRKIGEVIEYAPVDGKLDRKFTAGYQGDLYTSTMKWGEGRDCKFEILKLGKDGSVETLFQADTLGYTDTMAYDDHVILNCLTETKGRLFDLNLITGEKNLVLEYDVRLSDSGYSVGTRISGLEYMTELPSGQGFCYAVSESDDNIDAVRTFDIYYYSFDEKKSTQIYTTEGKSIDYIGGDMGAFIVGDIVTEDPEQSPDNIYIKEQEDYVPYSIPVDIDATISGSGVFGDGYYVAYGGGMYIVDAKRKKYDRLKHFGGVDTEGMGYTDLDYSEVTGQDLHGSAFYFISKDTEDILTLHKITIAKDNLLMASLSWR
jgi:hypothetical protein